MFSKNRDRLLRGDIAEKFFAQVREQARHHDLLSDEHFSVDSRHFDRGVGEPEEFFFQNLQRRRDYSIYRSSVSMID